MKYLIIIFSVLVFSQTAMADHELDIYSFDNLFIYTTFTHGSALKTINIVVLDDDKPLKVTGTVKSNIDANVDAFSNYNNYLIVLLWNHAEVFDLSKPEMPRLVKTYKLEEHKPWPGFGRIIKKGNTFLLFSTKTTSKLTFDNTVEKWQMTAFNRTDEIHNQTLIKPIWPAFDNFKDFTVKDTPHYSYIITWKTIRLNAYEASHEKYLLKISKDDKTTVSEILLGKVIESGGN